jgi:Flp pilus assembly protein TadG
MSSRRSMRRRAERGAVAAIVGMLLGLGVLLGAAAISIDVGSIMWERRQVQNGADAASMALALSCGKDLDLCTTANPEIELFNDSNAADGASRSDTLTDVCGRGVTGLALTCASASDTTAQQQARLGDLRECAPLPGWLTGAGAATRYVEVNTRTATPGGGTLLPPILAQAVTGTSGKEVAACARAAWGPPGGFTGSLPLAISLCEWQSYTGSSVAGGLPGSFVAPPSGSGTGYGGAGQPAFPDAYSGWPNKIGDEQYVLTHSSNGAACTINGKDTSGGFGWLSEGADCTTTITTTNGIDYWAEIGTGNNVPNDCKPVIQSYHAKVLLLPVFDCLYKGGSTAPTAPVSTLASCTPTGGGGGKTWYHLAGFASFYMSGNKLDNNVAQNSVVNGVEPCSMTSPNPGGANPWTGNAGRCLSGWFVTGALNAPTIGTGGTGGGNFGTFAVVPAG